MLRNEAINYLMEVAIQMEGMIGCPIDVGCIFDDTDAVIWGAVFRTRDGRRAEWWTDMSEMVEPDGSVPYAGIIAEVLASRIGK